MDCERLQIRCSRVDSTYGRRNSTRLLRIRNSMRSITAPTSAAPATDVAYGIATDGTDTYITGSTTSTNITVPNTTLAFQSANGGGGDAFVAKFGVPAISGTTQGTVPLDYFSYLGGSAQDAGLSIAADTLGNAYVTGLTGGSFPRRANAFQGGFGGGAFDAFVARLNTTGTTTTASTSTVELSRRIGDRHRNQHRAGFLTEYICNR